MLIAPITNSQQNFLTKKNYWINWIKFDTNFYLIFFILEFIAISLKFYLIGFELYFLGFSIYADLLVIIFFIIALYYCKKLPKKVEETIINIKSIFLFKEEDSKDYNDKYFQDYKKYIIKVFNNKYQRFLPLLAGIIAFIVVSGPILNGWSVMEIDDKIIQLNSDQIPLYFIQWLAYALASVILLILVFSALTQVVTTFSCINKMGSEKFKLTISYKDIKTGTFEILGVLIISLTIPIIILATIIGLIGSYFIIAFKGYIYGILFLILGIIISVLMTFLLYKDTLSIHQEISKWKNNLLKYTVKQIEVLLNKEDFSSNSSIEYERIQEIHKFFNEVSKVNDWPFNPTSLKKLVITLGSSVLPVILSLLGFA